LPPGVVFPPVPCQPWKVTPGVRYCTTPAGRIAYSVAGSGPALLCDPGWVTHVSGQLELFSFGDFMTTLAERYSVIRYDKPGCGLSDQAGADLSFDAQLKAALAVADAAGARRFALFGASQGGQLAAAIAARFPDRVTALALYGMCANGENLASAEVRDSVLALVRAHWGLGSKVLAEIFIPGAGAAEAQALTQAQRTGASAEVASRLLEVYYATDVTDLLAAIRVPTMVLHRVADSATPFALGRAAAAMIPGATLVPLPGAGHLFYQGEWPACLEALLAFLGEAVTGEGRGSEPALTDRELEVAGLVAEGLTNHAIAARLSVAPRTVESHVENIRRKLEVRSRAQIAAWVTERRLGGGARR
jgi:pimeloyl-ACP methyl ester carboxylesterase/DNA-binding CsgD family transcriptional regulator